MLFVLIHGAYASRWHWHRLVPELEAAGADVVVPELPCDDPEAGLERYVRTVEDALAGTTEPPVVVGSSLGGVTACVFAAGHPVAALATIGAIVPRPGRAVAEDLGAMTQPAFAAAVERGPKGTSVFGPEAARELLFHESDPDLAEEAAERLRPQANLPLSEPAPFEELPDVPRAGIVSGEDRMLRPEWLASAVRDRLGVEPHELGGDHAPMLSQPARLAGVLLEVAGG